MSARQTAGLALWAALSLGPAVGVQAQAPDDAPTGAGSEAPPSPGTAPQAVDVRDDDAPATPSPASGAQAPRETDDTEAAGDEPSSDAEQSPAEGKAAAPGDTGARAAPPSDSEPTVQPLPAELRPDIELQIAPEGEIHVGDPITITIRATAPKGTHVTVPKRDLEPFEVIDRKATSTPAEGAKQTHVFELTLIAFEPQTTEVPALELRVVTPEGRIGAVYTDPRSVTVASLLANEPEAEPAPPSDPVVVMEDDYTLAYVGGGVLAALLLAALGFWLARWYARKPKPEPPPPPPRPPWEIALEQLAALQRQRGAWLEQGRASEYVDRVSDITREYLGARYGFDGLESTTDELVSELSRRRPRELRMTDVVTLLQECDLVKFAQAEPDASLCDELHAQARRMIEGSVPAPATQTGSAAPEAT